MFSIDDHIVLVMEHVSLGSLRTAIKTKGRLDPEQAIGYLKQVFDFVATLHKADIVYRDLKIDQILIKSYRPLLMKFCDMKSAKSVHDVSTIIGTPQ